jgi:hypothetical protein
MLSVLDARRAAIALLGRCGEVAIAAAVLRAQEAQSRGRYEEMASWRSIAEAAYECAERDEWMRRAKGRLLSGGLAERR